MAGANLNQAVLGGVDLTGADLSRADLSGANFGGVRLDGGSLSGAGLHGTNLTGASLLRVDLRGAVLTSAVLQRANLSGADLRRANLHRADLSEARLSDANITDTQLREATLRATVLSGADLSNSDLTMAQVIGTDLRNAVLNNCRVYGMSAWDVQAEGAAQRGLIITPEGQPTVTVDNLSVGQVLYLFLHNKNIRDVLNATASKIVLVLGRFAAPYKDVLDALRGELTRLDYIPVLFDFEGPVGKNDLETILTLASLARFIIADLTDAKSVQQELSTIVPHFPSIPIQPILRVGSEPWSMYESLAAPRHWVLRPHAFKSIDDLVKHLQEAVVKLAEEKLKEIRARGA